MLTEDTDSTLLPEFDHTMKYSPNFSKKMAGGCWSRDYEWRLSAVNEEARRAPPAVLSMRRQGGPRPAPREW